MISFSMYYKINLLFGVTMLKIYHLCMHAVDFKLEGDLLFLLSFFVGPIHFSTQIYLHMCLRTEERCTRGSCKDGV